MDGPQEYEVESVTRARVHDKKGKKITWKYYVKWKGYNWDESTWEPTDSFQGGSEHILESFWERIDTGGRDISDATAFKKGEELLISGPPGGKPPKRKADQMRARASLSSNKVPTSLSVTISAPLSSPRKRRRLQFAVDDEPVHSKSKRRVSTAVPKDAGKSIRPLKRRRASSPGPRKSAPKRLPSAGDSQLDADGETDPDVVEVEDELMQVSAEDAEEGTTRARNLAATIAIPNGSKEIMFDDLEHFYSGNPIDIDQNTDEQVAQEPGARIRPQSPPRATTPSDSGTPKLHALVSPTVSSYDPLFDSPSRSSDKVPEIPREPDLPSHNRKAMKPLVKFIDATIAVPENTSRQSRITAKARLMSLSTSDIPSASGSSITKRRGKSGPGRSSSGLISKSRSSLLTASKGALKSVKGKFASSERDQLDEIEEVAATRGTSEGSKLVVTSWSDEDTAVDHRTTSNFQSDPPPSGDELLRLAGLKTDPEPLPDFEDDTAQSHEVEEHAQASNVVSGPSEEQPNEFSNVAGETKGGDCAADNVSPLMSEVGQEVPAPVTDSPSVPSAVTPPVDEAVKKNIELAKEHLFPSTQTSFSSFSNAQSSFRSTIFGPLYQGNTTNCVSAAKNEFSTTFKVILSDGVEIPLVLRDCNEIKARICDILTGSSSGGKVALFYAAEDALAMVSTFKGDGSARVVLDPSAEAVQRERFSTLLSRFQLCHTLIAPVGGEVCVLYSSENADIAEKLGAPAHLRGLSGTILISHASIENQLAYVGAVMKAAALP